MELDLRVWKRGGQRAPHKPLLLLYALGRWSRGQKEFPWSEVKEKLPQLIKKFGGNARPEASNPFARLRLDLDGKLWIVRGVLKIGANGNPSVASLNMHNNIGTFHPDFEKVLLNKDHFDVIVRQILIDHFKKSQFDDIIRACGLPQMKS